MTERLWCAYDQVFDGCGHQDLHDAHDALAQEVARLREAKFAAELDRRLHDRALALVLARAEAAEQRAGALEAWRKAVWAQPSPRDNSVLRRLDEQCGVAALTPPRQPPRCAFLMYTGRVRCGLAAGHPGDHAVIQALTAPAPPMCSICGKDRDTCARQARHPFITAPEPSAQALSDHAARAVEAALTALDRLRPAYMKGTA
jgi:hypothetical protein